MTHDAFLRRPSRLRRSWLFTSGIDEAAQNAAIASGADVVVADLEEFTPRAQRAIARPRVAALMARCRSAGIVGAVRINKFDDEGLADLHAVMAGQPDVVFLPHVESGADIAALAAALDTLEASLGISRSATEIAPTVESARGFVRLQEILTASPRIQAALLSAEDLTADLGAERGPDSIELNHLRSRFHVECTAAGRVAIDCPFNYRDRQALVADLAWARRIGLKSKCAVNPAQIDAIHQAFTPSNAQLREAADIVAQFEAAQRDSRLASSVDTPDFHTARRRLARAAEFQAWADKARSMSPRGDQS